MGTNLGDIWGWVMANAQPRQQQPAMPQQPQVLPQPQPIPQAVPAMGMSGQPQINPGLAPVNKMLAQPQPAMPFPGGQGPDFQGLMTRLQGIPNFPPEVMQRMQGMGQFQPGWQPPGIQQSQQNFLGRERPGGSAFGRMAQQTRQSFI